MITLSSIAMAADRLGLRRPLSWLVSQAYERRSGGRQRFFVDRAGNWVNCQPEGTIVSPIIHTTSYAAYRDWVLDNWCWQYLPKEGDTVIDVGAGVGEEAIIFSHLVGPNGRVISIEAHPSTYKCLSETIRRSGLANVTPICVALTDRDGIVSIANVGSHLTNSIVTGSGGAEVPARSLASLLAELDVRDIALLKMNIEGAERFAVRGMGPAAQLVANVCISCHDFLADHGEDEKLRTKREVGPMLESLGYQLRTRPEHADAWVRDYFYGSRA